MRTAAQIVERVRIIQTRNRKRDSDYMKLIAIRDGDYETVAPGLFNTAEFDKPLVANLVDTTARDLAEVMAPLPAFNCNSASLSNAADSKRQDIRSCIINSYMQNSRLQDQMFEGADRFGSFGFMAYIVEPNFADKMPVVRVGDVATASYTTDFRGRTKEYFEVYRVPVSQLKADHPDDEKLHNLLKHKFGYSEDQDPWVEVVKYYDDDCTSLTLLDPCHTLVYAKNRIGRCPVRIVERPNITGHQGGQFDDVIWVQIARALVAMYTMNAIDQAVHAPIAMPDDVQEMEMGPFTSIQSATPQGIQRVNLQIPQGLFPESQILAQEQRTGSRYPEGRSGSIDASIITGQGVQALMGTFDTQVQTFQRLNISALEDVSEIMFRTDEAYWPNLKKTRRIKDNGAPRKFDYVPSQSIDGDYIVDVTYGAIAGLDPNRGLVFVLQALAGGLIAKSTARKSLPVDINAEAEERQIQLEGIDDAVAATLAMLPQAIPMMASQGQDPREVVKQTVEVRRLVNKGESVVDAMEKVFAPKEDPAAEAPPVDPAQQALDAAAAGGAPPMGGGGGAQDLLMSLTGLSPSGSPQMNSMVSRRQEI